MMHPTLDDSLKNDLEPTMHPRLASNSESSCLCLLCAGELGIGATTSGFCLFVFTSEMIKGEPSKGYFVICENDMKFIF